MTDIISQPPVATIVAQESNPTNKNPQTIPLKGVVELKADQQEFDVKQQVITASGKVVMTFRGGILTSDRLSVNLISKLATASGNVTLKRGQQILKGDRFEYNFNLDQGSVVVARGDIYQPTLVKDLQIVSSTRANTPKNTVDSDFIDPPLSDLIRNDQPITSATSTGSTGLVIGSEQNIDFQPPLKPTKNQGVNRFRFQAEKIEFKNNQVNATNIRVTNDPFSPPEVEVRADRATFKTINQEEDEVNAVNPRLILEQGFEVPLFLLSTISLNRSGKDRNPFGIGYDGEERGGIFLERSFYPDTSSNVRWNITPQYFIQRAIGTGKLIDGSVIGLRSSLDVKLADKSNLQASASLSGLNFNQLNQQLRAKANLTQAVDIASLEHNLNIEAIYREKIFNGSLGFQDVQTSIGAIVSSPNFTIGNTGISANYQGGIQFITADTDRTNLQASVNEKRVTLTRYQTNANLAKSFRLWEGSGLPVNEKETYNYSPVPVIPYLQLNTSIRGNFYNYSSSDSQSTLGFTVGLQGQIGNFSRPSFDYTGFNIGYSQEFKGGNSPFLFDRSVDNRVIFGGINQHLWGPVRFGIQTSINIDTGRQISTDYYLEYSRRSYNILLRYNPVLQLGSIGFRLNDFNWDGVSQPF